MLRGLFFPPQKSDHRSFSSLVHFINTAGMFNVSEYNHYPKGNEVQLLVNA
jgi:hypothetical protein